MLAEEGLLSQKQIEFCLTTEREKLKPHKERLMPASYDYPGFFVTFEGGEGSGKSSLAAWFVDYLSEQETVHVVRTREPGGSSLGKSIRNLLLDDANIKLASRAEALLFAAERTQHAEELLKPALVDGSIVVCDRYIDSSIAYQGVGRGLGQQQIRELSLWGTSNLMPDWTVLLDVPPHIGLGRRNAAGDNNKLDEENIAFHQQVREAFLALASEEPERFTIIDATLSIPRIRELLVEAWHLRKAAK